MPSFFNRNPALAVSLPIVLAAAAPISSALAQPSPSPAQDAAALVRRTVANHLAAEAVHRPLRFVLHKKDGRRDYSQIVIETRQGDVAIAIAANGAPLGAAARQEQVDRLDNLDAHPDLQDRRRKHELEDAARAEKLLGMLPDAFLYRYEATVPCVVSLPPNVSPPASPQTPDGSAPLAPAPSQCYRLTFKPNPAWNPPDTESRIMRGLAGDLLIETTQERLTRLNAHLIADVDFGWGIIGHLDKGGTIFLEQSEVAPSDWELTQMKLNLTGRALLVKSLAIRVAEELSQYSPVPSNLNYHQAIRMLKSEPVAQLRQGAPLHVETAGRGHFPIPQS